MNLVKIILQVSVLAGEEKKMTPLLHQLLRGSMTAFILQLQEWQPAVAAPWAEACAASSSRVSAIPTVHMDFIVLGYHREAVEVLHPWMLSLDGSCNWTSQIVQVSIFMPEMKIGNKINTSWLKRLLIRRLKPEVLVFSIPGQRARTQRALCSCFFFPKG